MSLGQALRSILERYKAATSLPLEGHPVASYIRTDAPEAVRTSLGDDGRGLVVEGSPGQGNWATVPWISVFDPTITTSATKGYYVVYLFHAVDAVVHLSLNQGTTSTREEFGSLARDVLRDRAELMRRRISEYAPLLPVHMIDLGSTARLPGDYVAGHAMGMTYQLQDLSDEPRLQADLRHIVRAYRALTFRGGIEADPLSQGDVAEEFKPGGSLTLVETRRYALHKRIERNRMATRRAKQHHGTTCQACDLNFADRYGEIGQGFIEAHHLRPISSLDEGVATELNVADDFAVLCSNCHRMIHRTDDPSDLVTFRKRIRAIPRDPTDQQA